MNDLFKKLNVLVRASVNDLLDSQGSPRHRSLTPDALGKDIDHEVALLRQRVDDALRYEDELDRRVQTLQAELEQADQQADEAVAQGQGDTARRAVEQVQRLQNRLAMAESDLREHRIVTQELITRVNQLEAVVTQARQNQASQEPGEAPADALERASQVLAEVLREIREKIAELSEMIGMAVDESHLSDESPQVDEGAIEDDLARRRERLSKK